MKLKTVGWDWNEHCKIFRYNGDEFVFILQYSLREDVEVLASHILKLLKEPGTIFTKKSL